jgi:hypothetical protein
LIGDIRGGEIPDEDAPNAANRFACADATAAALTGDVFELVRAVDGRRVVVSAVAPLSSKGCGGAADERLSKCRPKSAGLGVAAGAGDGAFVKPKTWLGMLGT